MGEITPGDGDAGGEDRPDRGRRRYGRRAVMLGAGAAGAGLVATLTAGVEPAVAADNSPVELGESNTASASTVIQTSAGNGLNGFTTSDESYACGLLGESSHGIGVYGTQSSTSGLLGADGNSASAAVVGDSGAGPGVLGLSAASSGVVGVTSTDGSHGVYGASTANGGGYGVYGDSVYGTGVQGVITGDTQGQSGVSGIDKSTGVGGGHGVYGRSTHGIGVYATSADGYGVSANSVNSYALYGQSTNGGGVAGLTSASGLSGVGGSDYSTGGGYGVHGFSDFGTGVYGTSNTGPAGSFEITDTSNSSAALTATTAGSGPALEVDGVAAFSRSGVAILAGSSSEASQTVTVTGVALTDTSLILATPQGVVAGVAVEGVVPDVSGGSFEIYLTKAIKVSLNIAWFVVG